MSKNDQARWELLVSRTDMRKTHLAQIQHADLQPGEVELEIRHFALSANNITYAVLGHLTPNRYFAAPEGYGHIPVWGFATVARSRNSAVTEGERVWGFLPIATHLVFPAQDYGSRGFMDGSAHRQWLPDVYNRYARVDLGLDEDIEMLFRPLFLTAYVLEQFLRRNGFFGAKTAVLSSASSKTALCIAHVLKRSGVDLALIGLTSGKNVKHVSGFACYDRVLDYRSLETLDRSAPTLLLDMAGNGELLAKIHHHLATALAYSCRIGFADWERMGDTGSLPGPQPTLFAAPAHIPEKTRDWGPGTPDAEFNAAWTQFVKVARGLLKIEHVSGQIAIKSTYEDVLEGRARPDCGVILEP